jgi:hypothetical protein
LLRWPTGQRYMFCSSCAHQLSDKAICCPQCGAPTTLYQTKQPKSSSASDLLTNFFHEGISRITPGLVVLALYAHKQVIEAFKMLQSSSVVFGLGLLVSAWLIGLTLDIVAHIPFSLYEWIAGRGLKSRVEPEDERERLRFLKDSAELVLLRSLVIISLFTFVVTPHPFSDVRLKLFSNVTLHSVSMNQCTYLLRFGVIFLYCLAFWRIKFVSRNQEDNKSNSSTFTSNADAQPVSNVSTCTEKRKQCTLEWWKTLLEIVFFISAIPVAVFAGCQLHDTHKQLIEMHNQVLLDERAWVTAYSVRSTTNGANVFFTIEVKNSGKTPAINVTTWLDAVTSTNSEGLVYVEQTDPTNTIKYHLLGPENTYSLGTESGATDRNIALAINSHKTHLYVYGKIDYEDIFRINHWTRFCWRVTADLGNFEGTTIGNSCDDSETNQSD